MSGGAPWVALVVDWNGTIVNDVERAWRATVEAVRAVGQEDAAPRSLAEFRTAFTLPMEEFFRGLGVSSQGVERCVRVWNAAMLEQSAELTPGARELLEAASAAGVPVAVVSGAHERLIHQDSAQLEVAHLIADVHGSAHPKRDVLRRYASRGQIAYVGDTAYDVKEGGAAGALTFAVDFGYGPLADLAEADHIVSDLSTLVPMFGRHE